MVLCPGFGLQHCRRRRSRLIRNRYLVYHFERNDVTIICETVHWLPIVLGPFHYCASGERAAPDAPETIDDQRRCTGCRYRTIYGGWRGSASLPVPAKWLGPSTPQIGTVN